MISSEDALLLLRKWKTDKAPMRFVFAIPNGGGSFLGSIGDLTDSTIHLIGSQAEFILSLAGSKFEYGDSREAPEALQGKSNQYIGCLTALFTSQEGTSFRVSFFEMRVT